MRISRLFSSKICQSFVFEYDLLNSMRISRSFFFKNLSFQHIPIQSLELSVNSSCDVHLLCGAYIEVSAHLKICSPENPSSHHNWARSFKLNAHFKIYSLPKSVVSSYLRPTSWAQRTFFMWYSCRSQCTLEGLFSLINHLSFNRVRFQHLELIAHSSCDIHIEYNAHSTIYSLQSTICRIIKSESDQSYEILTINLDVKFVKPSRKTLCPLLFFSLCDHLSCHYITARQSRAHFQCDLCTEQGAHLKIFLF